MTEWNLAPDEIEKRSFAIIDAETPPHDWMPEAWSIVRRMVHTSADFEYVHGARLHAQAIEAGVDAIRQGKIIVTDTRMAQAGMSTARLGRHGVSVDCLIDHAEVISRARETGTTRAFAAVDVALETLNVGIYVVGNAPTALFRLLERIRQGAKAPDLIVGLPVGFVNAAESKEALSQATVPFITNLGRKGGSNVAAAVINALAILAGA